MEAIVIDGHIICPKCGRRTKTRVLDATELKVFPLWCTWCKQQTIVNRVPRIRVMEK